MIPGLELEAGNDRPSYEEGELEMEKEVQHFEYIPHLQVLAAKCPHFQIYDSGSGHAYIHSMNAKFNGIM